MFTRIADSWEPRFSQAALKQFGRDRERFTDALKDHKSLKQAVNWDNVLIGWQQLYEEAGDEWRSTFVPLMRGVIDTQAEQQSVAFGFQWDVRNLYAEAWFDTYTMTFAEEVVGTTGTALNTLLQDAQREGWGIPQVQDRLGLVFDQWMHGNLPASEFDWFSQRMPAYRRELIARSEIIRSSNAGINQLYRQWGVEHKEWLATEDDRTCPWCMEMNGKIIPIGGTFWEQGSTMTLQVGQLVQSMTFNYEAVRFPPLHPFCRCALLPWKESWAGVGVERPAGLPAPAFPGFPGSLDALVEVRGLGGTTGTMLVRDPATGTLYVRKMGTSAEHLLEETYADSVYRALGINVPEFNVYQTPGGPVKLSRYIPDTQSLADFMAGASPEEMERIFQALRQDFVADALLANWDVVGLDYDNILIDQAGKAWRIDNGGAMRFRAQGAAKTDWTVYPSELWSLRNPAVNSRTARVFADLDYDSMLAQMEGIVGKRKAILDSLPKELQRTMRGRLDQMADLAKTGRVMRDDLWGGAYVDSFSRHTVGLRKSGVSGSLPRKLTQRGTQVFDEKGVPWDKLRGDKSVMFKLRDYMEENGGDLQIISHWMESQGGSSWSSPSQVLKWNVCEKRGGDASLYYWRDGVDHAKERYGAAMKKLGQEKYDNSWTAWHAFNRELLQKVDFPQNNKKAGTIRLFRTESANNIKRNNLTPGATNVVIKRGGAESASVFETVSVAGSEVTVQDVPHHRILGGYFTERIPGTKYSPFYGDRENEFVFIPEGIPFNYIGTLAGGTSTIGL